MSPPTYLGADAFAEVALVDGVVRRRIAAGLIDATLCLIAMGLFFILGLLFGIVTLGFGLGILALLPFIPLLYNFLFLMFLSATPGQRIMGLLVRRNEDLGPPGAMDALVWSLGFTLTLTFTAGLLWLCMVLVTVRKRALHDMVPGLVVVRESAMEARSLTAPAVSWNMPPGGHPTA